MLFKEIILRQVIVGWLKRYEFMRKILPLRTGGTNKSSYCYSVWLRHLVKLNSGNISFFPYTVAELGPGDSLGVGIAALLSGVKEYFALDVQKYWNPEQNVRMLDELVVLFKQKAPIPYENAFAQVTPILDDYSFPSSILTDEQLKLSLSLVRIEALRKELLHPDNKDNVMIKYFIPWSDPAVIRNNSIDLILSQCVLEHIDELKISYEAMSEWLKDGAMMSHVVDFKSHGFTKSWNGHWTLSESEWKMARGGRVYAINRMPFSTHLKFIDEYGFTIVMKEIVKQPSKVTIDHLSHSFSKLTPEDISVSWMYFVAQKK